MHRRERTALRRVRDCSRVREHLSQRKGDGKRENGFCSVKLATRLRFFGARWPSDAIIQEGSSGQFLRNLWSARCVLELAEPFFSNASQINVVNNFVDKAKYGFLHGKWDQPQLGCYIIRIEWKVPRNGNHTNVTSRFLSRLTQRKTEILHSYFCVIFTYRENKRRLENKSVRNFCSEKNRKNVLNSSLLCNEMKLISDVLYFKLQYMEIY